eukprot:ANDGO_08061.mRNA.1 putative E3 ubiquitin-protein ligase HERC2
MSTTRRSPPQTKSSVQKSFLEISGIQTGVNVSYGSYGNSSPVSRAQSSHSPTRPGRTAPLVSAGSPSRVLVDISKVAPAKSAVRPSTSAGFAPQSSRHRLSHASSSASIKSHSRLSNMVASSRNGDSTGFGAFDPESLVAHSLLSLPSRVDALDDAAKFTSALLDAGNDNLEADENRVETADLKKAALALVHWTTLKPDPQRIPLPASVTPFKTACTKTASFMITTLGDLLFWGTFQNIYSDAPTVVTMASVSGRKFKCIAASEFRIGLVTNYDEVIILDDESVAADAESRRESFEQSFGSHVSSFRLKKPRIVRVRIEIPQHNLAFGTMEHPSGRTAGGRHDPKNYGMMRASIVATELIIRKIALDEDHLLVLSSDGQVYGMGNNHSGQIGIHGLASDHLLPVSFLDTNVRIKDFCTSHYHSIFLTAEGYVYVAGDNSNGALGLVDRETVIRTPTILRYFRDHSLIVQSIACGFNHSLFMTSGHSPQLFTCGLNSQGQCGWGSKARMRSVPTRVHVPNLESIFASGEVSYAVAMSKGVLCSLQWDRVVPVLSASVFDYSIGGVQRVLIAEIKGGAVRDKTISQSDMSAMEYTRPFELDNSSGLATSRSSISAHRVVSPKKPRGKLRKPDPIYSIAPMSLWTDIAQLNESLHALVHATAATFPRLASDIASEVSTAFGRDRKENWGGYNRPDQYSLFAGQKDERTQEVEWTREMGRICGWDETHFENWCIDAGVQ